MPRSEMMESFFQDAHEALGGLEQGVVSLQQDGTGGEDQTHMNQMVVLAHRLRGTAGLYGFPQISNLAGVGERLLESRPHLPPLGRQQFVDLMGQIIALLREGLNYLDASGKEMQLGLEFSRLGGTKALQELVYAYPDAFKPQSAAKQFHEQQLREQEADQAEVNAGQANVEQAVAAPQTATLEQELQQFYKANTETWEYYAPEIQEHLDALREQLALGEQGNTDVMFRSAHTIKGSSYMVGFTPLGDFAHQMEDLLGAVRDGVQPLEGHTLQVLQDATDTIEQYLRVAQGSHAPLQSDAERLRAQLRHMAQGEPLETFVESHVASQPAPASNALSSGLEQELQQFYKANTETWEYYAPEIQEHLEALREQLALGSQGNTDVMFRSAHTIKGSSYMVGFTPLGDFAHKMEDLLGAVRDGAQPLEGQVQQTLETAADTIEQYLRVAEGSLAPLTQRAELLQRQMQALAQGDTLASVEVSSPATPEVAESIAAPVATTVRVRSEQLDALMSLVGDLVVARSHMTQTLERLYGLEQAMSDTQARFQRTVRDFEERYLNPDMVRGQEAENASGVQGSPVGALNTDVSQQFDELEFDTYNDLNILARSITELSADFGEMRTRFSEGLKELSDDNEDFGKLVRRMRQDISRTSRVPFSQALIRLRRWARERSDQFELKVEGESLEVENSVLQNLNEPLLHLLTNAVFHGIGTPEDRLAQGKSPLGHVTIEAKEVGSFVEVSVADDGQGLNLDAIRIRALERGQRSAQELAEMSNQDLARLILLPGLSTAKEVTAGAGRGVGMDVVASSMRRLGGDLLIHTQAGVGTRITLRVPTSQQIIDVLQVRMGDQMLGFATSTILALREVQEKDLAVGDNGFELLDAGQWLSILDLREMWGLPATNDTWKLVILRSVDGTMAVRVDDFDRIEEVAVSPLTGVLSALDYITATSVSTTGEVLPILDPTGLQRLHAQPERWIRSSDAAQTVTQQRRVLLVDDSLSVRRLVSRMLERGGYEVQTANDGQEAFDLLQFGMQFDLVVTDLEMPRMNGYELLEAVRGRQMTHNLPMVVMTTRAGDKHQRLAFQLGANDYFSKPVDEALLLRRLGKILEEQKAS